ncbi:MAG: hypothetical protein PHC47_01815, partial [Clostridia bacterium]|nr:hypothetical protein [Clostridia bacterium]
PEFVLSENIEFEKIDATYKEVKFLAFSGDGETVVTEVLQSVSLTNKYNLAEFGITGALYEIKNGIVKASGTGLVSIIAVIIKTDYLGRPVYDTEGNFQVYAVSTPQEPSNLYRELNFNIGKTVQDMDAKISVCEDMLKNIPGEEQPKEIDKLSFMKNQNQVGFPVFKVEIVITADLHTEIEDEVQLFVNAWNEGRIQIKVYALSGIEIPDILYFEQKSTITEESGEFSRTGENWVLSIDVFTLECYEDIDLYLKLVYEQTENYVFSKFISDCILPTAINDIRVLNENPQYLTIEIYDGYAATAAFAVETDSENPIIKTLTLEGTPDGSEGNKFIAETVELAYFLESENQTEELLNEDGSFKVVFEDKYENEIEIPPSHYTLAKNGTNIVLTVITYSSSLRESQKPNATLYIYEENIESSILNVSANGGKIEDNEFSSKFDDITQQYNDDSNYVVKIARHGAKGSDINLLGEDGLLTIEYITESNDEDGDKVYQLYNIINYNITNLNWQNTYSGFLSLSVDERRILVENTIGKDIILNIVADTGLGSVVYIELTIKPNISMKFDIKTEQPGASDYIQKDKYYGIYSDNDVVILLTFTMVLNETVIFNYGSDATALFYFGDNINNQTLTIPGSYESNFTIHYLSDELGMQEVEIKTGDTSYDYNRLLTFYVSPNLKLVNAENGIVNETAEISELTVTTPVLEAADYVRIIGSSEINSGITLNFATNEQSENIQVYIINNDGSQTIIENIFEIDGFEIKANSELFGKYLAILDVRYGGAIIGQIHLTITTNFKIDTEHSDYSNMFIDYNGITHLVLVAISEYDFDYIQGLFLNVNNISFNPAILEDVYESNSSSKKIYIDDLNNYINGYYLSLNGSIGTISYPVLFSPLEIGFVSYNENSENADMVQIANNDIEYLRNSGNFLIENNIFDTYNSGTSNSLLKNNYEIIEVNEFNFKIKNYSNNSLYLLAHNDSGYFTYELKGIKENNVLYEFSLQTLTGWEPVADGNIVIELHTTDIEFIGVFATDSNFSNVTRIEQEKDNGLSINLVKRSNLFNFKVIDENSDGTVDFGTSKVSGIASYNRDFGILETSSLTQGQFVWLLIYKGDNIVITYRIYIMANSGLNIYYPYGNGTGVSSADGVETDDAEYVNFTGGSGNIIIDFKNIIHSSLPNCSAGENIKRIMFQYGNEQEGWTNAPANEYSLSYSFHKMLVNGVVTQNPSEFAYFNIDNNLVIYNTSSFLIIYVKVSVLVQGKDINAAAYYKIVVNHTTDFGLYYISESNEITNEFTQTTVSVDFGGIFDFSDIVLVTDIGSQIPDTNNLLDYHLYSAEGKDLSQYLELNKENKTLSLKSGVQIVSDLKAHLIMYTKFGELIDVEVTFKSDIDYDYNTQGIVDYNSATNTYEVYADTEFNLSDIFTIISEGVDIGTDANWEYSLDGGQGFASASNISFEQLEVGDYTLLIKVLLSELASGIYKDDYTFLINLKVKESIISNYSDSNKPLKIENIEYPATGKKSFDGFLYVEDLTTETDYLLRVQDDGIFSRYEKYLEVATGSSYATVYELNFALNRFILDFRSPGEEVEIKIALILKRDDQTIKSFFSFRLTPDLNLVISYPSPDDTTTYDSEAFYLGGDCINEASDNKTFSSRNSETIKFDGKGFFETTRIKFVDSNNEPVEYSTLGSRVVVTVESESNNIVVAYKRGGVNILNTAINLDIGASVSENFYFQWVGTGEIVTNITATVKFNIYIDEVQRGFYNITFYSNINSIFTISIENHNQTKFYEGVGDAEVFFVENGHTGLLFSVNDALLTFTLRESYINLLQGKTVVWEAYVDLVSAENLVGSIEINANSSVIKWPLSAQTEITFDNLIIKIEENEYVFNLNAENKIFTTFVNSGADYTLTNRATAKYFDTEISYDKFLSTITFGGVEASAFTLSKNDTNAINKAMPITIEAEGIPFDDYYYTLLYDFKIDPYYSYENYAREISADGIEIGDILKKFSITKYNGQDFSMNYFARYQNILDAYIIMVTDKAYETTNSTDNVKYLNKDYIKYLKPEYEDIAEQPEYSEFVDYISLSYKQDTSGKTYEFTIRPNGAENEGNYAYILVSFKASQGTDMAYAIIKVLIQPVWSTELYNANLSDMNTESEPLYIYYRDGTSEITPIHLSLKESSSNYINIYKGGNFEENYAVRNYFRYYLEGELNGYLKLEGEKNSQNYYNNRISLVKDSKIAIYGDKSGHLKIIDKYGFVIYYYIELSAQSDESLSFSSIIIGTSHNDLYEGSTISIVNSDYNAENNPISTDYAFKLNNLNKLETLGFKYEATYSITDADVNVESYNENPFAENYNTGKIPVQPAAFYKSSGNRETVNIKIELNITTADDAPVEIVAINTNINIVKRYTVSDLGNAYVRDGVAFNISDYVYIRDAKAGDAGEDVGEIILSGKAYTLIVPDTLAGATITVAAMQGDITSVTQSITIGADEKQTTYGNYYYSLKSLPKFKDMNFTMFSFSVISVSLPSAETGFYLSKKVNYLFDANGNAKTQIDNNKYIFNNPSYNDVSLVYRDGSGRYYYNNYNKGSYTISIPLGSGWKETTHNFDSHPNGTLLIYKTDFSERVTETIYNSDSFEMIPDKLLSVVTLDLKTSENVFVALNNKEYLVKIPFTLNYDGIQNVSIYEAILTLCENDTNHNWLRNILNYEKDSEAMSIEDLQKLKGIMIYNDTITLDIADGMADVMITVKIFYNTEKTLYKVKEFKINNNNAHYYFISIHNILGDSLGLDEKGDYKIEIFFTLTNVESGQQENLKNKIKLVDEFDDEVTFDYNQENLYCTYKITVESFKIESMANLEGKLTDTIKIQRASDFKTIKIKEMMKSYLVKYPKDAVIYSIDVNYKVTPKYYAVDEGDREEGGFYKVIYNNEYTEEEGGTYSVAFDVWSNGFNLLGFKGNNQTYEIQTVTSATEDLFFEIQTTDENKQQTGSGAATLDENNLLRTTTSFNPDQHYIKVLIYAYVDKVLGEKVQIGEIFLKIDKSSISVPAAGTYNLTIRSPEVAGTYYKINTPYEFEGTVEKISNIVESPKLVDVVKDNKFGFYTGTNYDYRPPEDCSFSVITVISSIERPVFKDGEITVRLNLNETENSINQKVTLNVEAQPKYSEDSFKTSDPFNITVKYEDNQYKLDYEEKIITKEDGYYTITLTMDIFYETFVGSDYTYKINIVETTNDTLPDPLSIVYVDNFFEADVNTNDTIFFQISYVDSVGSIICRHIGIKYTEENKKLSSSSGFALNIKSIEGLGLSESQLANCTTSFLGSFDLNECIDGISYKLLLSYGSSTSEMTYSLANVQEYSESEPFLVEDYALSFIHFQSARAKSVKKYDFTTTGESPTYIYLDSGIFPNENRFYGVVKEDGGMDLYAIKPSSGYIVLDVNEYSDKKSIKIKDLNNEDYISTNISDLFGVGVNEI